jgi:hypothetical protein
MAKQYWHDNITDKSFIALLSLKKKYQFTLIGGWAVYLYTKKLKSKDIDIIVDFEELGKFKNDYQLIKNERLKKYEINLGEFDIDIYLPHYSRLGFPLEKIKEQALVLDGFRVPNPEVLLALKLSAYQERRNSTKGEKDKIDIISLIAAIDLDPDQLHEISLLCQPVNLYSLLKEILSSTTAVAELGLGNQAIAKLRKSIYSQLRIT